jgi:hypothetical protein
MTEAPKGLMTSKELGMAVADRLVQAEKQRETPGSESTPKQQVLMRRKLQPPATEQQPQHNQKDVSPALVNPDNHGTQAYTEEILRTLGLRPYSFLLTQDPSRRITPGTRGYYDFDRARVGMPPITDEEWKEREERDRAWKEFDRLPPEERRRLVNQWYQTLVLPDSKSPEKMTFWGVIGELAVSLLAGVASSLKDKSADKE